MKDAPDSPTLLQPEGIKKRFAIPTVFIGVVAVLLLWGIIRGNWTDAEKRNPSSPADGVMIQLLRDTAGRKQTRAAVIVSAFPERVWKVVTNYDHFSDVFPTLGTSKGV